MQLNFDRVLRVPLTLGAVEDCLESFDSRSLTVGDIDVTLAPNNTQFLFDAVVLAQHGGVRYDNTSYTAYLITLSRVL